MKLALALCAAGLLDAAAAGPYHWLYYPNQSCSGKGFGCRDMDAYICCKSPPGRESYKTVQIFTDGPWGVPVFTRDVDGNCGTCQFTGNTGRCYGNESPFNNGYVLAGPPSSCVRYNAFELAASSGDKVPAREENGHEEENRCRGSAEINYALVDGVGYTVDGEVLHEVAEDMQNLSDEEFGIKWAHLRDN